MLLFLFRCLSDIHGLTKVVKFGEKSLENYAQYFVYSQVFATSLSLWTDPKTSNFYTIIKLAVWKVYRTEIVISKETGSVLWNIEFMTETEKAEFSIFFHSNWYHKQFE